MEKALFPLICRQRFAFFIFLFFIGGKFFSQSAGYNSSYAVFSRYGNTVNDKYCMFSNTSCGANSSLDGTDLGTFHKNSPYLYLKVPELNVWKCNGADITAANFNYRVYSASAGGFMTVSPSWTSEIINGCSGADQIWNSGTTNVNLLLGLNVGNYTFEAYCDAPSTVGTQYLSNNGNNYKATFTITANPVLLYSGTNIAGGTYYATLKDAFDAVNAGIYTGNLKIEIYDNTTETTSAVLNASGNGAASYSALSIRPAAGMPLTVSGAIAAGSPLIDLNGADNVTIDGLNSGGNSLTIANTTVSNTVNTSTIRFINDATSNTITNCTISGSSTVVNSATVLGGTIIFSTGNTGGNDNNAITGNNLTSVGANLASAAISSVGSSAAVDNSNNQIINNNIQDYYSVGNGSFGIFLGNNNSSWTVSGNKFFQTATRTSTAGFTHEGIKITSGNAYTISGNTIGYANSASTGVTVYNGAFANRFIGIDLAVGTTVPSSVQGNTIAGINLTTTSGASTTYGIFSGIYVTSGNVNIGTVSGNNIGNSSSGNSLSFSSTTNLALINGIASSSTGTVNIQNNIITSVGFNSGATIGHTFAGIGASGASGIYNISNNTIGSTTNSVSVSSATTTTPVSTFAGITNSATGTVTIAGNTIQNITVYGTSGSNVIKGVENTGAASSVDITNNKLQNFIYPLSTVGSFTGIVNSGAVTTTINITNNQIGTAGVGAISFAAANSGSLNGVSNTGGANTAALTITGNDIRGISYNVASSAVNNYIINSAATLSQNISNNTFTNLNVNTAGNVNFISNSVTAPAGGFKKINSNSVVGTFTKGGAGGTVYLYYDFASSTATAGIENKDNNFSNITLSGTTVMGGWYNNDGAGSTPTKTVTGNTFSNWTTGTGSVTGMNINYGGNQTIANNTVSTLIGQGSVTGISMGGSGTIATSNIYSNTVSGLSSSGTAATVTGLSTASTATANNIYQNKVYDLSNTGAVTTSGAVNGILLSSTVASITANVYNNLVGDLKGAAANSADAIRGISVTATGATSNYNLYENTVYLSGTSSGATFGTSGIYHSANATATTAKLDLRNNLIINNSTPTGAGIATAFRRSAAATLGNYASTSNNNLFYSGTPSSNNTIMSDGTNNYQTFASYQTAVSTRDNASVTETAFAPATYFISTVGSNAGYLKPADGLATLAESGGSALGTPFDKDFGNNARPLAPGTGYDIGAWEFNGVNVCSGTPSGGSISPGTSTLCNSGSVTLSVSGYTLPKAGITYIWQSSTDNFATNIVDIGAASSSYTNYTTPTLTTTTYYRLKVTCSNSSTTAYSTVATVTVNTPTVIATTLGSHCGPGAVTLGATGSSGTTLNWYDVAAGGTSLGTGTSFTTPSISATTDYWVSANFQQTGAGSAASGTGTVTNSTSGQTPFSQLYEGIHTQYLVLASDLVASGLTAGNLTSLSLNVSTKSSTKPFTNYTVKLGSTSATSLTGLLTPTFTQVYLSSSVVGTGYSTVAGQNVLTFGTGSGSSSSFNWDGVSNIVVDICFANDPLNAGTYYSSNDTVTGTTKTYTATWGYYQDNSNLCGTSNGTNTSTMWLPNFTFAGQVATSCYSPRTKVTATITPPPALTVSADQTICNGAVSSIAVTSTLTNYDNYTWNLNTGPVANGVAVPGLYTDAAATTSYLAGTNQSTVYVKNTVAGTTTYKVSASNAAGCANFATTAVNVLPGTMTVTANPAAICLSGTTTLTASPSTGLGTATLQWQDSADGITFADISGATGTTYTTATLTADRYYKVILKNGAANCTASAPVQVVVNNPQVLTTVDGTRCGTGTVILNATGSAGTTLNWYATATGGVSLGTGTTFTTPSISATTDYWVSAANVATTENAGRTRISTSGYLGTNTGLVFSLSKSATIVDATIYPVGTGTITFALQNSSGTELMSTPAIPISGGTATTAKVVPLNFNNIPAGTGYRLVVKAYTGITDLVRESSIGGFPYNSPSNLLSITNGYFLGTTTSYYYFYNITVQGACESARTKVTATVTTPPAITLSSSSADICSGDSTPNVTLTSATGNYSNYTWNPAPGVSGSAATGWTFNPTVTTTYTLNASNTDPAGCANTTTFTVNVNPAPTAVTVTATEISAGDANSCANDYVKLDAVNNDNFIVAKEGFENSTDIFTADYSNTWYANFYWDSNLQTEGTRSINFEGSDLDGPDYISLDLTNSIDLTKYGKATLTFDHICASEAGYDFGVLYYSTNNGSTWNLFPTTSYLGTGTLKNGCISFDKSSYTNWNTAITSSSSVPTNSLWKSETIDLSPFMGSSKFKIAFSYEFDALTDYYGWNIDNIKINATPKITWDNASTLFTNSGLSVPYVAGSNATTVYATPTTPTQYTATASLGTCTATAATATAFVRNKKLFTGADASDATAWDKPDNWSLKTLPTLDRCVNIPNMKTAVVKSIPDALAKSVTVENGGKLTINANRTLKVSNEFVNQSAQGDVMIESDGNLWQVNESASTPSNSGAISARRTITIKDNKQYNYLISPLINGTLKTGLYEGITGLIDAPFTLYYNETNNYFYNSTGAYIRGRGLAVKEPAGTGTINALVHGVPQNGVFNYTLANSGTAVTGYNLIGNPYPSNIDLNIFYNLNTNANKLNATFRFWDNTVNALDQQQGSGYSGVAYAVFNAAAGSTGTGSGAGWITGSVIGAKVPTNVVKTGQGFIVRSSDVNNKVIDFSNSIRTNGTATGFFGNTSKPGAATSPDDRFWLDLASPSNVSTQVAVVYFANGNNDFTKDDSELTGSPSEVLYTVIGDKKAVINGRAPFVNTDVIPLGSKHFTNGSYTFSLGTKEGVFATGQNIYLKDIQTGTVTNLSEGDYTFTANAGEVTGRFEIIYQPEIVLATDGTVKEELLVYKEGTDFVIQAKTKKITGLEVFDGAGRLIYEAKPNQIKALIDSNRLVNGVYILKINQNGVITSKKVIK